MKRIEAVITPSTWDAFKEAAPQLGIAEFTLVEIHRSSLATSEQRQRVYRASEFTFDLLPRLRVEFVLFDEDVEATLHELLELVRPESIAVFGLDRTVSVTTTRSESATSLRQIEAGRDGATTHQVIGFLPRKGGKDSDKRCRPFTSERSG